MIRVVENFLEYVKFHTTSSENSASVPTTEGQIVLAKHLADVLKKSGLSDVSVDNKGYVMAALPSNVDYKVPVIGFIAHMDTSPDMSGENVKPQFIENYDGKDIVLNSNKNIIMSVKDFPELKNYIGETIITTDGTTLLGADDKAGVAEIITAMQHLLAHPEIKHGTIKIGFTPDEEVGAGADYFDVAKFGAEFAYTVDGGAVGELEYENFNAAGVDITINGKSVHPGSAKNKMVNSMLIAADFIQSMPEAEVPSCTEGYEGFYHLTDISGGVELTTISYIIRDFEKDSFEKRKLFMQCQVEKFNEKYGKGTLELKMKDQYYNMKEIILEHKSIIDTAFKAIEMAGVTAKVVPIRGGTDGARLSFMGLPTPNLFTGGENFHGKYEYIPVSSMEKAVASILNIIKLVSEK